ncbi:unnamed protein product [Ceratitis capitata]|uniref:(Mediterranean fruit fly) hypothetical protein n=1 Tax=Ceratitis capitata TaxID=7213 RepID=A0A811V3C4_CERCA|nr:unnamed protein product [Ceratitis capitata]
MYYHTATPKPSRSCESAFNTQNVEYANCAPRALSKSEMKSTSKLLRSFAETRRQRKTKKAPSEPVEAAATVATKLRGRPT